jgi:hypothetical protein
VAGISYLPANKRYRPRSRDGERRPRHAVLRPVSAHEQVLAAGACRDAFVGCRQRVLALAPVPKAVAAALAAMTPANPTRDYGEAYER